jgi:hypothetical protein
MPMNEFFIDDLNDNANTFSDANNESNKSLHRLYLELKNTVMGGYKFLLVEGECPHVGFLRQHKLTITLDLDADGGVMWTRFSGWKYRSETTRVLPLGHIVRESPTVK